MPLQVEGGRQPAGGGEPPSELVGAILVGGALSIDPTILVREARVMTITLSPGLSPAANLRRADLRVPLAQPPKPAGM